MSVNPYESPHTAEPPPKRAPTTAIRLVVIVISTIVACGLWLALFIGVALLARRFDLPPEDIRQQVPIELAAAGLAAITAVPPAMFVRMVLRWSSPSRKQAVGQ
jgi:hypothetical protein